MSNYTQGTFFSPKDALTTGDPAKTIKGSEIDPEFSAIETAIATKVDTAATGLSISATTVDYDLNALAAITPVDADIVLLGDADNSYEARKVTLANLAANYLNAELDHDLLTNFVANEHIDHSTVNITGGVGLTNGGDITASRTIDIDWPELTAEAAIAAADLLSFYDDSAVGHRKITFAQLEAALDPANFGGGGSSAVLDSRVLTAGSALSGGGDLSADRTFDLDITEPATITSLADDDVLVVSDTSDTGANKGITAANALGVQLGELRATAASAQSLTANTPATVIFGTSATDNLTRGTYNTGTGAYTAGSAGARLLVSACVQADTLGDGRELIARIRQAGTTIAEVQVSNQADNSAKTWSVTVTAVVVLAASQSVDIQAETSSNEDLASGAPTTLSIVELG